MNQTPFATMVAIASLISAPELLLAHSLAPESNVEARFLMFDEVLPRSVTVSQADNVLLSSPCGPIPGSEAWEMSDPATRSSSQQHVLASSSDVCLAQALHH